VISEGLERKMIYFVAIVVVALPLVTGLTLPPASLKSADRLFRLVEGIKKKPGSIAMVAFDFGPSTKAENEPQAELLFEHLMRRRIPVAVFSLYPHATGFLSAVPERVVARLQKESPNKKWLYGEDWVNLGYRPGMSLFIQAAAKSDNLTELLGKDVKGSSLSRLPAFEGVSSLENISFLGQVTGLVGIFDIYVQFFQKAGYVPPIGHGCTSITIPEAYIYLDSGQLQGLLEGITGTAWYSHLLKQKFPFRVADTSLLTVNTALGFAQLLIIFLIVLGNIKYFRKSRKAS
jgi:hypothetical protein